MTRSRDFQHEHEDALFAMQTLNRWSHAALTRWAHDLRRAATRWGDW